mmetsp:Transcript_13837/g.30502  ORF Transcript_13837/g.30502 Transcript_13837/m.30502 type:complete len:491 (+) Transcript_13837:826-2298(+)
MNCYAVHSLVPQIPSQLFAEFLHVRKDDDAVSWAAPCQNFHQLCHLVTSAAANVDLLRNVLVGSSLMGSNLDMHRPVQVVVGQHADLARPRSTEHHSLTPLRNGLDQSADLGLETHVQHTVGFIKNQKRAILKAQLTLLHEVVEPARCAHDEVAAVAELSQLGPSGCATVDTRRSDADLSAEFFGFGLDLAGQLSSRSDDQHVRSARIGAGAQKLGKGGQQKGERFATASLGDTNEVTTLFCNGPAIGLDWSGSRESQIENACHNRLGELTAVERGVRLGDLTVAPHLRLGKIGLFAADLFACHLRHRVAPRGCVGFVVVHDVPDVSRVVLLWSSGTGAGGSVRSLLLETTTAATAKSAAAATTEATAATIEVVAAAATAVEAPIVLVVASLAATTVCLLLGLLAEAVVVEVATAATVTSVGAILGAGVPVLHRLAERTVLGSSWGHHSTILLAHVRRHVPRLLGGTPWATLHHHPIHAVSRKSVLLHHC